MSASTARIFTRPTYFGLALTIRPRGSLSVLRATSGATHLNRPAVPFSRPPGAKMVALAVQAARTKWGQLELVMRRWSHIEELAE
jgi:hypothetical protein